MKLSPEERALFVKIGTLGGNARKKALPKARRVAIAKLGAQTRWKAQKARQKAAAESSDQ